MVVNLRLATDEASALGVDEHVCEVQLVLAEMLRMQARLPGCRLARKFEGTGGGKSIKCEVMGDGHSWEVGTDGREYFNFYET